MQRAVRYDPYMGR